MTKRGFVQSLFSGGSYEEVRLYLDGEMILNVANIHLPSFIDQSLSCFEIGGIGEGTEDGFRGKIDHIQIDKVLRPSQYIKFQAAMAAEGQQVILVGPARERPQTFEDILAAASSVSAYAMNAVYENDASHNLALHHVTAPSSRVQFEPDGTTTRYFYILDHLGSTRMVIAEDGAVGEALHYTAYGEMDFVFSSGNDPAREKFTGKEFDEEGGENGVAGIQAYHFGARCYDADVGIWLSTDPAGQYWNVYKYASNPITYVDPDGRFFGLSMFLTGATIGYIKHGVNNDDWGTQAIKSGLWSGAAVYTVSNPKYALQALTLMQTSQGIANVAQNKAEGFFPNVRQFLMGTVEGALDFTNIANFGLANKPISYASGSLRGYAYNKAQGITGDAADLNIEEARQMNYSFGNYLGQGTIVKAASDYIWALEGGNYSIGWDERYKYAKAKRLYAEGGYSNTNSKYLDYISDQDIHPERIEMASWAEKQQGKWNPQFGHGLGGTLFSHEVWHDGFETYGEPYESFNQQDYSDDWGLWTWYNNYW